MFYLCRKNTMKKKIIFFLFITTICVYCFSQEDTIINREVIPIIILSDFDLESNTQSSDISGFLQSSADVYTRTAGYNFGRLRYKIRGYDNNNTTVLLNGIVVNNAETGRPYYSNWGGLNDATRYKDNTTNLAFSDYSFGSIAGVTNIKLRPSQFKKQTSISYAFTNQSYQHRVMASYNSGMLLNNWAFSASFSTRLSPKETPLGFIEGGFYESYSYYLSAEKKINNYHTLVLTGFASPTRIGKSSNAIQEAYDLTGNNYYNPSWGYQNNGKDIRNAKISNTNQPRFLLSHYWIINEKSKITTTASFLFGRNGQTALNWYDVADPRPDYYRCYPSYYNNDDFMFAYLTEMWKNDKFRQLDWDSFYFANSKNLYTITNESGSNQDITGNRAKYIVEEYRSDEKRGDINSLYSNQLTDNLKLVSGLNVMISKTHNFKVLNDLLGADFWLDIDRFAERDTADNNFIQNDIEHPNRAVKKGDTFGYDYISNINKGDIFGQLEGKYKRFDFFAGINLSYTNFWRYSSMTNGKFPDHSGGSSPKQNFFNYAAKAGLTFKISGHHYLLFNAAYLTRAPFFSDAYVSPITRDFLISDIIGKPLENEKIVAGDLNYNIIYKTFTISVTGYYTEFINAIQNNNFYHDELRTFVNYIMTNINKRHFGAEFGIALNLIPNITITAASGYGKYLYSSRPSVTIAQDNSSEILATNRTVYIKNYHIGNTPEFAANIGIKYSNPHNWNIGIEANYFDEIYATINPERRTEEAVANFYKDDTQISEILNQTKIKGGFVFNIYGGKSWLIQKKYNIGFRVTVDNVLNNKKLITSAYEQFRCDYTNVNKFPMKYSYMHGTIFFANIFFRF